uniref:Mitochondrial inner membrane protease ATP23 n=1 Tax=Aegilops tauschii subsp. strangulata TaxID=200361 RepID=A0A453C830_AEGTS
MAAAAGDCGSVPRKTTRAEAPSASDVPPVPRHIMPHEECVAGVRSALKDPTVRFLRERMEKAGCTVWPMLIRAATCASAGGYASREGIEVCCNHMEYPDQITQTITHELIHAYDDCVGKNMDWTNCAHHACSEVSKYLSYKWNLLACYCELLVINWLILCCSFLDSS